MRIFIEFFPLPPPPSNEKLIRSCENSEILKNSWVLKKKKEKKKKSNIFVVCNIRFNTHLFVEADLFFFHVFSHVT